jgi:hypothetical protein
VDASIMATLTSTSANEPPIMKAESGAVVIKAAARERLVA